MYLVFTRMPGEGYARQFTALLLCSCDESFERSLAPFVNFDKSSLTIACTRAG